jgi:hypothetical protein
MIVVVVMIAVRRKGPLSSLESLGLLWWGEESTMGTVTLGTGT